MATICGAAKKSDVTQEVHDLVSLMQPSVSERIASPSCQLEAVEVMTQVVAGTNYFVKAKMVGTDDFLFLRIYKPLPHTGEPPELAAVQTNKGPNDPLAYFEV